MPNPNCPQCEGTGWFDDGFIGDDEPCDCEMFAERTKRYLAWTEADIPAQTTDDLIRFGNGHCHEAGVRRDNPVRIAADREVSRRTHLQNDSDATRKAIEHMAMRGLI